MTSFRRASNGRINVFTVDESYLFKQYFESGTVLDQLTQYYYGQQYRPFPSVLFDGLILKGRNSRISSSRRPFSTGRQGYETTLYSQR